MPSATDGLATPRRSEARGTSDRRLDLDVVRGVAILLAIGWHFNKGLSGNGVLDALQWPGRTFGWAGVDLFFVLSGFLVGQLVFKEHKRTGRFDGWRFTWRRALKLWPVLYVFLAIQGLFGSAPAGDYLWQSAFHVQNYIGLDSFGHLWSLAVEEHFYLVLVVLFPLAVRRRFSPRVLLGVLAGLLVAALALRVWGQFAGVSPIRLQWRSHFRVDALAAGVLLAAIAVYRPAVFDRLLRLRPLWVLVSGLGLAWLVLVPKTVPLGTTVGFTVAYLTSAAFLLSMYRAAWVPRARLVTAPMAALGRFSYGVYIWHTAGAMFVLGFLPGDAYHQSSPLVQVIKYTSAIAVGVLATALVEKPVLRLRDRLLPGKAETPRPRQVDEASLWLPASTAPSPLPLVGSRPIPVTIL